MRIVYLSALVLLSISLSCNNYSEQQDDSEDISQIVSLLYSKLAKPIDVHFPPPSPGENRSLTRKDSIKIDSVLRKIKEKNASKRTIVAINPYTLSIEKEYKINNCDKYNVLLKKGVFVSSKDSVRINIETINNKRNDSIIYFSNELLEKNNKDFFKFDLLLTFSNILFHRERNNAIVIAGTNYSKLAGFTSFYFLEKRNNTWYLTCEEGLSIL